MWDRRTEALILRTPAGTAVAPRRRPGQCRTPTAERFWLLVGDGRPHDGSGQVEVLSRLPRRKPRLPDTLAAFPPRSTYGQAIACCRRPSGPR